MKIVNENFSQTLEAARQSLPKLGNFPNLKTERQEVAECLQYYVGLLNDDNTTAADLGRETANILRELAERAAQIAAQLAPDDLEIQNLLEQIGYYE